MSTLDRRSFLKSSAAAVGTLSALAARGAADRPGEKVVVAVMGVHGRGRGLVRNFARCPDAEVAYVCDVDENVIPAAVKLLGDQARGVVVTQVFPSERSVNYPVVKEAMELARAKKAKAEAKVQATIAPAKPVEAKPAASPAAKVADTKPAASPVAKTEAKPVASPAAKAALDQKAVADFYRGKTIRIIVGTPPGGFTTPTLWPPAVST